MIKATRTYLNTAFTTNEVFNSWNVAKEVNLYYNTINNSYMLTDYNTYDEEMYGDVDFDTIIYGTLGECLRYVHITIRRLKWHI